MTKLIEFLIKYGPLVFKYIVPIAKLIYELYKALKDKSKEVYAKLLSKLKNKKTA